MDSMGVSGGGPHDATLVVVQSTHNIVHDRFEGWEGDKGVLVVDVGHNQGGHQGLLGQHDVKHCGLRRRQHRDFGKF